MSLSDQVQQVAQTGAAVLLLGETGVGKELVARAVHRLSTRHNRPMVKVNCAALPSTLVESERFSGPAIDDAVFGRLFRPFYTTRPDGLSMGLGISRFTVEAHGGRLWPARRAAVGLVMHFTLPAEMRPA